MEKTRHSGVETVVLLPDKVLDTEESNGFPDALGTTDMNVILGVEDYRV